MNEPAVPDQPDPPALSRQDAARLLAEQIVNSSPEESGEITYDMVQRIRARQAAERKARGTDT